MERDSGSVTAAFHGCRSAVGADCAPADAWPSSEARASAALSELLASTPRDLEDIAPPLSATQDEIDEPGEEANPYTLGRGEGGGTAHASRFERGPTEDVPGWPAGADRPTGGKR